jgi:hypothetical protein
LRDWDPDGDIIDEELVEYFDRFGERYGHLYCYFEQIAVLRNMRLLLVSRCNLTLTATCTRKIKLVMCATRMHLGLRYGLIK